ncbi:DNA-protecting protein DprA [Aeromicrobium fastidiosum]|uniref:DNA-processing protein DprA n=1 Tax=Aeromicrobium fastidiosum TaxID=52699 RepID=UPI0020237B80|nr:DNA-processing protein DprA [Aeromicrobium fastidiosum]MCL8251358.1 DNA-protecting protein DprA [Aeromicrobium fastidiosum]
MTGENLKLALAAFATYKTPAKISAAIRSDGVAALNDAWESLPASGQDQVSGEVAELLRQGTDAVIFGQPRFPSPLISNGRPAAPVIFFRGDFSLFDANGVGMCGSRTVSDLGMQAARACGEEVSARGLVVTSGYAKGVDTETHLASLRTGGRTVIVLAEGINHFRVKKNFKADFDPSRVLVVSQFPPNQPWGAYAAMDRNKLIFGLGKALVVIEAGDRGGTLAAGQGALKLGRPVFVLDFGRETPAGNRILLGEGGRPIASKSELGRALDDLLKNETIQGELPI